MKELIKNNIKLLIGMIIGVLISSGVVYAVNISSANVDYDNSQSGIEATTVEGAINELYQGVNAKLPINTFGEASYNSSYGTRGNRTASITLNKGKYLIDDEYVYTQGGSTNFESDGVLEITCDKTCNKTKLSSRFWNVYGGKNIASCITKYFVEIINDDTVVSSNIQVSSSSSDAGKISIQAIPINE